MIVTAPGLTVIRRASGVHAVMLNGDQVGEVWNRRRVAGRGASAGFGLRLAGIYWSRGVTNRRGGLSTTTALRMKDAIELAARALDAAHVAKAAEQRAAA